MIEAKPNCCQEVNFIIPTLPCNKPAHTRVGWPGGEGPYRMCGPCAHHSINNRGAEDLGPFVKEKQ